MSGRVMNVLTSMGFTFAQEEQKKQILLLDKEFDECKTKAHDLTAERDALRAQVEPLKKENKRLKDQLEDYRTKKEKNVVHDVLGHCERSRGT